MLALDLLPPLEQLFGLSFLNISASRAYTAAGSFAAWLKETHGPDALKQAYRTADVETAANASFFELEAAWKRFLATVPKTDADEAAAKYYFDRPSIIGTTCVHEVEKLLQKAKRLSDIGDHREAIKLLAQAHERSNRSTATQRQCFFAEADAGDSKAFRKKATQLLKDPSIGRVDRHAIQEILLDLDIAKGTDDRFEARYLSLAKDAKSEADRRRLEAKAHLAAMGLTVPKSMFEILALRPQGRALLPAYIALTISDASRRLPEDPVIAYLHARQYFLIKDFDTALSLLEKAEQLGLKSTASSLWTAAHMMEGTAYFHLGRLSEARLLFRALFADPNIRLGQRERARDWVERADFESSR
jgi:hypothetical protein